MQSLQAAIAVAPEYQPVHYYYGLALAKTGQQDASQRELKVATQMADEQNRREAQRLQLAPGRLSLHRSTDPLRALISVVLRNVSWPAVT